MKLPAIFLLSCVGFALVCFQTTAKATPPAGNWTPTFTEDFSGGTVSSTTQPPGYYPTQVNYVLTTTQNVWNVGPRTADIVNNELEGYEPGNISVSGGCLNISILNQQCTMFDADGYYGGPVMNYSSGMLQTYRKYTQTYGYFEASIKMPSGMGLWPAFWLLPDRGVSSPNVYYETKTADNWSDGYNSGTMPTYGNEIDVVEYMSTWQAANGFAHGSSAVHAPNGPSPNVQDLFTANNTLYNPNGQFHTYGLYWGPGVLRFYIDNVQVYVCFDKNVATAPCYMLLNCAITTNDWVYYPNIPVSSITASLPATMQVDYVHVWQGAPIPPASDLALNAVMSASSSDEGSFSNNPATATIYNPWSLALVVDGNSTSSGVSYGWRSNSNLNSNHTEWLEADLGAPYPLNNLILSPRTDHPGAGFPVDFTIQTSMDNATWSSPVVAQIGYPAPGVKPQTFSFPTTTARYVKITGTSLRPDPSESNYYRMAFAEITATNLAPIPQLVSAASVQSHAGTLLPLDLPLTGTAGVECRSINKNLQIVLTFDHPVTAGAANISDQDEEVSDIPVVGTATFSGNTMTVPLSNVADSQTFTVNVAGLNGTAGTAAVTVSVLQADVNGDGVVNSRDLTQIRNATGDQVGDANFTPENDITEDGVVSSRDLTSVRNAIGNQLP